MNLGKHDVYDLSTKEQLQNWCASLQVALDLRDQFLVDNGHWDDFVGSLPLSPKEPDT